MHERLYEILGGVPAAWEWVAIVVLLVSIALPVYTYFGYPLLLAAMRSLRRPRPVSDLTENELPAVTMVVAAHNEAAVIAEKVKNFLALDYPKDRLDLVIGSDGSNDKTTRIALEAAEGDERVEVQTFKDRRGKVSVLNDLVPGVDRPLVIMSDANTMYQPDAVLRLVRHFADERVGGVCGRLILTSDVKGSSQEEGLYWRYETFLKRLESELGGLSSINGQVFAFRRKLYEELPADAMTEDQHLGLRIMARGFRVVFENQAVVKEPLGNLETERRRRLRISTGNFQTLFRVGLTMLNPLRGFPAFAYVSHKVLRFMAPLGLALALLANMALLRFSAAQWLFIAQSTFYMLSALPVIHPFPRHFTILRVTHYFVSMNLTIILGFLRYCFGYGEGVWQRTER